MNPADIACSTFVAELRLTATRTTLEFYLFLFSFYFNIRFPAPLVFSMLSLSRSYDKCRFAFRAPCSPSSLLTTSGAHSNVNDESIKRGGVERTPGRVAWTSSARRPRRQPPLPPAPFLPKGQQLHHHHQQQQQQQQHQENQQR